MINEVVQAPAKAKFTSTLSRPVLLQRKCACGETPGLDGECAECRKKRLSLQRFLAEEKGKRKRGEEECAPPIVHEVLRTPGQPLDPAARAFMESRFGHDFSRVRVHIDGKAAESARAVNALAYTLGSDIVFGAGQYQTHSWDGRRLLAHELVHVVQQGPAPMSSGIKLDVNSGVDRYEVEAEQTAAHTIRDNQEKTAIKPMTSPAKRVIQRQPTPTPSPSSAERDVTRDCAKYITMSGVDACEFYRCREANSGNLCGPRGYYIGYGLKYCQRFSQVLYPILSSAGKDWLNKTRLCLMEHIHKNIAVNLPCASVKQSAFDSHPDCYVKGGICFLPTSDWEKIIGIIDSADNDLKQVIITGISCLFNWFPMAFPATSLAAGGGLRGLMERDRLRAFGPPRIPSAPIPPPTPTPPGPVAQCTPQSGDVAGERIRMTVNTTDFLNAREQKRFEDFADAIKSSGDSVIVHGLTSDDGPAAFNDTLSCTRAQATVQRLQQRGVPAGKIVGLFKHGEVSGPAVHMRAVVLVRVSTSSRP